MDTQKNVIKDLDAEELALLARRYYTTRFPNPQRLGCPPPGEIVMVVSRGLAPDQDLREHLFECSECFGEYRQALAQRRTAPEEVTWRRRMASISTIASISTLKRSVVATATMVMILSSLFFIDRLIWPISAPDVTNNPVARSTPSGAGGAAPNQIAAIAMPPVEELSMGGARKSSSNVGSRGPGDETIDVDLDDYQVFRRVGRAKTSAASEGLSGRGGSQTRGEPEETPPGEKIISLPATRANLVLRLPESGVPGKYNVSLINAFGRPLLSNSAFSSDGVKLRMTLDLRRVPRKKYRLRLGRNGEAPAFYDVIVGAR
jgi:hypothetical protein